MIGPAYLMLFVIMEVRSALLLQARPALLSASAIKAFSTGRGELVTGAMRAFTQHMRIRPYIIYTMCDTIVSILVLGRVYGFATAAYRWCSAAMVSITLSWGFELYMRRLFVARQLQAGAQQQQQKVLGHACGVQGGNAAADDDSSDLVFTSVSKYHKD